MLIMCHLFNQHPQRKSDKSKLPKLSDSEECAISDYNAFVLKSFTNFFIHLSAKLKEKTTKDFNVLPLSKMSFSVKENVLLKQFMNKWTYEYSLASPFAALSALRDESLLNTRSDLFFNCLSILHIDSKVIPIFTRTDELSDYALKFFNGDLNVRDLRGEGILMGDLVGFLKDFKTILIAINNCLMRIAPKNDLVRVLFAELCAVFEEKFHNFTRSLIRFGNY